VGLLPCPCRVRTLNIKEILDGNLGLGLLDLSRSEAEEHIMVTDTVAVVF
jgi:hypothetical protein